MTRNVLVVDDSLAIRQSVSFILKQNGYSVVEAVDGQDGLEKLRGEKADLIITDVNMPKMDGITMVQKTRELTDYRYTPILVLTTEAQTSKMNEGKEAGATGWIVKPFSNEKLLATIRRVLG